MYKKIIYILMASALLLLCVFHTPEGVADGTASQVKEVKDEQILSVRIEDVVSDPGEYNGKKVTLEGKVVKVDYTKSSRGEPFTIFKLKDSDDNEVNVYYEDEHLPISKGDKVKIMGRFRKEKNYFLYKIKNVIKARTVELI